MPAPKKAAPSPSTKKPRDDWYLRRSAFPMRDAPPFELESIWKTPGRYRRAANVTWTEAGPRNYAGRVTSLLSDPLDSKTLYAGAAAGGLWRSTDIGNKWTSVWPKYLNQNIGALAADPNDRTRIICATGEGNLSSGTYPGAGIFRSRDQGFTWSYFVKDPENKAPAIPRRIASIAVGQPRNERSGRSPIAFGCVTKDESLHAGLFLDMGAEGLKYIDHWGERSYNCHSVVFHPKKAGLLYVAIEPRGTLNGIWRSENFGKSWEQINPKDFPADERFGRISLAISPTHPNVLYALVGNRRHLKGVYKTTDGGDSWELTDTSSFKDEGQINYNNTIAVHPTDPDFVMCGIINIHLSRNGGANWHRVSTSERDGGAPGQLPANFVHSDQHALIIQNEKVILAGHDGGVSISQDGGVTWKDRSRGLVTTMFYDVDVCAADSRVFGGGAQDAGSLIAGVEPDGTLIDKNDDRHNFTRVLPGDGGWLVFDPANPFKVFAASADSEVQRHDPGQPFSNGLQLGGWKDIKPKLSIEERVLRSLTLLAIRPAAAHRPQQLWLATSRLWCTVDNGAHWNAVTDYFDNSAISALEFSPADPDLILVGTTDGNIFRSNDNGATWSPSLAGPGIPRRVITQIRIHPADPRRIFLSVGSSTAVASTLNGVPSPYSHIFCSNDQGDIWKDIDGGKLPNVVFNGLAIEARKPHRIFAGGDAGVWASEGDGAWINISGNIPNAIISDLVYHAKDNILTAATYGRGIWRFAIPPDTVFEPEEPAATASAAEREIVPPALGLLCDHSVPRPVILAPDYDAVFRNPKRLVRLRWSPVPNAIGYGIKFENNSITSREPFLDFERHSDGPCVWRVWAILPESRISIQSLASRFSCFAGD